MKDLRFTVKRQRTELFVFGICFLIAFALNAVSIIVYKTEWKELYTQLCWVLMISIFLYFTALFFRLIYRFFRLRFCQKKIKAGE